MCGRVMKKQFIFALAAAGAIALGLVIFALVHHHDGARRLILYGNVDVRQVDIGFRVPGQVISLLYEEGDLVKPGELVAQLDETPYISELREAEANLASVQANLENAEILLKRRCLLIESGGVSQEDLDDTYTHRNVLLANKAAAEAAVQIARDNLIYTKAYAPNEGIVLTRIREPGTVVNPTDPVYTLSLTNPVWIRAYVGEPDLGRVYYGMEAEVSIDTKGAPTYTGKVGFISPIAEFTPKTVETTQLRTDLVYRLRIYVDHPDAILKQGMPVTVECKNPKPWPGT